MSIASPPPPSASRQAGPTARVGSDQLIESRIAEACKALWWAELVRTVLGLVVFSIAALLVWIVFDQWIYSPGRVFRVTAFTVLATLLGLYVYRRLRPLLGSQIRPEYAARSLERDMPELRHSLTSYVTLRDDQNSGDLRSRVVRSIGASTASRLRVHDALPHEATGTIRWWVATACALAVLVAYAAFSPKNALQSAARLAAPIAAIDPPRRVSIRDVQPGNSDAIAGRSVEISAEIAGLRSDEEVVCSWELPTGRQELKLERKPDSRRHSSPLPLPHSASGIVRYWVAAGDAMAGPFVLSVQDVPVVALESVFYTPPKYTGQTPYHSSNGAITAVDGTTVKILATTNREVAKAKIEFNPRPLGEQMQATAGATEMRIEESGTALSVSFPLRSARGRSAAVELEDYRILVWDASGQGNPDPIVYPIRVVPDLPPEVAITVPASSPKEIPIDAQQTIEVHASDPDFGLKSITLEIRAGIDLIDEPVLWTSPTGEKGHRVAEFPLRPSELRLRIGDTVQVVAIAADNRSSELYPNVEPNLVRTDPVTLKITAGGELPDENDPNADGLSSPDERATESDQSAGGSSGDSGQQQSGGGGSGSGAQQQSDGNQGEGGAGGKGETSDSSGDSNDGEGSGNSESDGSDQNQGNSGSASGASDSPSAGDGQNGEAENGDSPSEQGGKGNPGDASDSASSGTESGDSSNGTANNQNQQDPNSNGARSTDQGKSAEGGSSSPQNDSSGSDAESNQSGSGVSGQSEQGSEPKQAPKHDGEAFERIQEYLEKNQGQQPQGTQGSEGSQGTEGNQDSEGGQGTQQIQGPEGSQSKQGKRRGDNASSEKSGERGSEDSGGAQQSGGPQNADKGGADDGGSGKSETGTGDASDQDSGEGAAGDGSQESDNGAAQSSSEQSAEDSSAGDSSADDQATGDQSNSGDSSQQSSSAGNRSVGDPSAGKSGSAQEGSEDSSRGQGDLESSGQNSADGSTSADSDSSTSSSDEASNQAATEPTSDPGDSNSTAKGSSGGTGEGGDQGDFTEQTSVPPDPVNVEYARKATDLVLDYLERTRESPDPQLLEELKWSKEDLQNFSERWKQIREMSEQSGGQGTREVEEALRSLGMRAKNGGASSTRESSDALRGIRDSGNRKPPPAAFRDAFDAFRRAVGQSP